MIVVIAKTPSHGCATPLAIIVKARIRRPCAVLFLSLICVAFVVTRVEGASEGCGMRDSQEGAKATRTSGGRARSGNRLRTPEANVVFWRQRGNAWRQCSAVTGRRAIPSLPRCRLLRRYDPGWAPDAVAVVCRAGWLLPRIRGGDVVSSADTRLVIPSLENEDEKKRNGQVFRNDIQAGFCRILRKTIR